MDDKKENETCPIDGEKELSETPVIDGEQATSPVDGEEDEDGEKCKGCLTPQPCRNQTSRPENVETCRVLHGLGEG